MRDPLDMSGAADREQARADRVRRANDIEALAQRLACSPLGALLAPANRTAGRITVDEIAGAIYSQSVALIDEGARRRREAEADPLVEVKP